MTGLRSGLVLCAWVALAFSAAAVGAFFPPGEWYAGLTKPPWNPPGWVFGPVWSVLYVTIGVAGWWLWQKRARAALVAWAAQLALNAAWSWLFFGLHRPGLALVDILALLGAIAATVALAWRPARAAAWLLVPYGAWVGFAATLNGALWWLNS